MRFGRTQSLGVRDMPSVRKAAELRQGHIALVVSNDAGRRSFTVQAVGVILLVAGADLSVLHEWRIQNEAEGWGCHSIKEDGLLAILSTPDAVRLVEPDGSIRWSFGHASWAGIGSGCAWFDEKGRPFAVVPATDGTACRVVALDGETGALLDEARVEPEDPSGMSPVHQPDGWVGVAEAEGENASRAWWIRRSNHHLDLVVATRDDEHLLDVDAAGRQIITTTLTGGIIRTRSFPELDLLREIRIPNENFILGACFVRKYIVARLYYREVTVAIDERAQIVELDVDDGWLVPAAGSWLSVSDDAIRRWSFA